MGFFFFFLSFPPVVDLVSYVYKRSHGRLARWLVCLAVPKNGGVKKTGALREREKHEGNITPRATKTKKSRKESRRRRGVKNVPVY